MTMSGLISWRNGWRSAAAMSMPLARASIRARSRMVTMSWSRSHGFSSRRPIRAITHTTRPTTPQIRYSCVQNSGFVTTAGMVALPTTATIRLPSTGPLVQKPMAVARPTCGEKSRISAGRGHQADALDGADDEALNAEGPLVRRRREDEQGEDGRQQQADHDQVGPAQPVGQAREQRAERADQVPEGQHDHVEGERHVEVGQDQRGHRAADIQLVVQRDRGQDREGQVEVPAPGRGVRLKLAVPQSRYPARAGCRALRCRTHPGLPAVNRALIIIDLPFRVSWAARGRRG